jgi:hypothetical protein
MTREQMIRIIENMVIDDRLTILKFLHSQNIKIVERNEGSHINLDKLDAEVYDKLVVVVNSRSISSNNLI